MKFFKHLLPAAAALLGTFGAQAQTSGWPANYQGVMLQAYSSDSNDAVSWDGLKAQADELSRYFSIIRVPNCIYGGDPVMYWFDFNSTFGSKLALREMVMEFGDKNVSVIGDVVLNHRCGIVGESGMNFPFEAYNDQSFCLGTSDICSDDDILTTAGLSDDGGFNDSGEGFAGLCDLDHRSHNVQNICKSHLTALRSDLLFSGFCYDFVKGYGAEFTQMYNEEIKPGFSVGEYFNGSVDMVKNWIDGTGKTSAAYDFPCKFALNKAFSTGDMTNLVWKFNGVTDQPAGMISEPDYKPLAVTLVEDNKTAADDYNKFTGDVVAANAFILFSPGTPCVYLPHWTAHKAELGKLIELRNAVGIHSQSEVKVLKSTSDCYMAEITGTQGKAAVRIGTSTDTPSGYDATADLRASGERYAVWSAVSVPDEDPAEPVTLAVKLPGGTLHIPEPAGMELKLTPDEGYQLHTLTLGDEEVTADVAGDVYTVPELAEPKALTAVFTAATALDRVEAPAVKVAVYGNRVEISGTDAEAAFYDAMGRLIRRTAARSVELPARSGVVIMTLGGETFKFAL